MKVACFFSDSLWASWSLSHGLPEVLKRMGHDVHSGALPPVAQLTRAQLNEIKSKCPTQEQLQESDAIIICGAEYLKDWILLLYPEWKNIKTKKLGWFHESFDRADRRRFSDVSDFVDAAYLPNPLDAETYKAHWLPIGVDTEMFKPYAVPSPKPQEIAFVGLLYEKRAQFLATLVPHVGDLEIRIGNIQLLGADNDPRVFKRQTEILAKNYCEMEILLNLPTMSNVLVMKVLEAMACGTFVVTPEMQSTLHEKLGLKDGEELVFYSPDKPQQVADVLRYFVEHDQEREDIALRGRLVVTERFKMESRMEEMLNG